jgi:hypothetical protein
MPLVDRRLRVGGQVANASSLLRRGWGRCPVTVVSLPARGRPPQAAARRAGLEFVEKLRQPRRPARPSLAVLPPRRRLQQLEARDQPQGPAARRPARQLPPPGHRVHRPTGRLPPPRGPPGLGGAGHHRPGRLSRPGRPRRRPGATGPLGGAPLAARRPRPAAGPGRPGCSALARSGGSTLRQGEGEGIGRGEVWVVPTPHVQSRSRRGGQGLVAAGVARVNYHGRGGRRAR